MGAIERDVVVTGLRGGVGAALARDLLLLGAPRVWLHHPSATDAVRATDVDASAGILRADDVDAPLVGAVARRLRAYGDVDVLGPEPLDAGATALADAAAVCACDGAGPLATSAGVGEAARRANRAFVLAQARDLVGAVFVDAGRDPWNTLYRALRPRTAAANPANPPGVDPAEAASHAAFLARHPETRWLLAPKVKNTSDGNGNAVANAAHPSAEPGPAPAAFASRVAEVAANALAVAMHAATRADEAELSQSDGGAGSGSGSSASPLSPPRQWFHVDASDLAARPLDDPPAGNPGSALGDGAYAPIPSGDAPEPVPRATEPSPSAASSSDDDASEDDASARGAAARAARWRVGGFAASATSRRADRRGVPAGAAALVALAASGVGASAPGVLAVVDAGGGAEEAVPRSRRPAAAAASGTAAPRRRPGRGGAPRRRRRRRVGRRGGVRARARRVRPGAAGRRARGRGGARGRVRRRRGREGGGRRRGRGRRGWVLYAREKPRSRDGRGGGAGDDPTRGGDRVTEPIRRGIYYEYHIKRTYAISCRARDCGYSSSRSRAVREYSNTRPSRVSA